MFPGARTLLKRGVSRCSRNLKQTYFNQVNKYVNVSGARKMEKMGSTCGPVEIGR